MVVFVVVRPFLDCVGTSLPGPGLGIQAQRSRKQDKRYDNLVRANIHIDLMVRLGQEGP